MSGPGDLGSGSAEGAGVAPEGRPKVTPWPVGEEPPVPEEFVTWLVRKPVLESSASERPGRHVLFEAALGALDRALHSEGLERRGAFDLLAADGLVTYAARAALEEESPRRHWENMVVRLLTREGDDGP